MEVGRRSDKRKSSNQTTNGASVTLRAKNGTQPPVKRSQSAHFGESRDKNGNGNTGDAKMELSLAAQGPRGSASMLSSTLPKGSKLNENEAQLSLPNTLNRKPKAEFASVTIMDTNDSVDGDRTNDFEHTRVQGRQRLASRGKTRLSRVKSVLLRQSSASRSLPKSVEAPISVGDISGLKPADILDCVVILLDGSRRDFRVNKKTCVGQELMEKLIQNLGLTESEFFGLTYEDPNKVWHWLRLHKSIKKDIKRNEPVFEFQVKFYPAKPEIDMKDDITRYFLCCQIRQDILSGKLPCSFWSLVVLGAYSIQADFGDTEEFLDMINDQGKTMHDFFRNYPVAPAGQQTSNLIDEVCEVHKILRGLTQSEADIGFLEHAVQMSLYGMDFHRSKNEDGDDVLLGINHEGVALYNDRVRLYRYSWARILKLTYLRNAFTIHLNADQYGAKVRRLTPGADDISERHTFMFPSKAHYKLSKRCFRSAVDNHWFFKLHAPDPQLKSGAHSIANVFRPAYRELPGYYVGPTQEQLRRRRSDSGTSTLSRSQSLRISSSSGTFSEWSSVINVRAGSISSVRPDESPAPVRRSTPISGDDIIVTGRGVKPSGVRVGDVPVLIVSRKNGETLAAPPNVTGIDPDGEELQFKIQSRKGSYAYVYQPLKPGVHKIKVESDGRQVTGSPFSVTVGPPTTSSVRAYGPGLERAVENEPVIFTVHPNGSTSPVTFEVDGPSGVYTYCRNLQRTDGSSDVCYIPPVHGQYAVHVRENGQDIPESPWIVDAIPQYPVLLQEESVLASGPGVTENGLIENSEARFTIKSQDVNTLLLSVTCFDALNGQKIDVSTKIDPKNFNFRTCSYVPPKSGPYVIYVTVADINVLNSPFHVDVAPDISSPAPPVVITAEEKPSTAEEEKPSTAEEKQPIAEELPLVTDETVSRIRASGRGLMSKGVRTTDAPKFNLRLNGASGGKLEVNVIDPDGNLLGSKVSKDANGDYVGVYQPQEVGPHIVAVTYAGKHIRNSPFAVEVAGPCKSTVGAFGPGLSEGVTNQPAIFTIRGSRSELSQVRIDIDGPSQSVIMTGLTPDGTVDVKYIPNQAGEYVVHVEDAQEDIAGSPFVVQVEPDTSTKLGLAVDEYSASGPGVSLNCVVRQKLAQFTVAMQNAVGSEIKPQVSCYEVLNSAEIPTQLRKVSGDEYEVSYTPGNSGWLVVYVRANGVNIPQSPFHVNVLENDAQKVKVSGPGISEAFSKEPTFLSVQHGDTIDPKRITVKVTDANDKPIATNGEKVDKDNMKFTFTPPVTDTVVSAVLVDEDHVPGSPFHCHITHRKPPVKVSGHGVRAEGVRALEPTEFAVERLEDNQKPLEISLNGPTGAPEALNVEQVNKLHKCSYLPKQQGKYQVGVKLGGDHVEGSPFAVNVGPPGPDIRAFGPGLTQAVTALPAYFTVAAKDRHVKVFVKGPTKVKTKSKYHDDGTIDAAYVPPVDGHYRVCVKSDDVDVRMSPWKVVAKSSTRALVSSAIVVTASGSGIEEATSDGNPVLFSIDATRANVKATPVVTCFDADTAAPIAVQVEPKSESEFLCKYVPAGSKAVVIYATHNGVNINGSPFHVPVINKLPAIDICGRGVQRKGIRVDELVDFTIRGEIASDCDLLLTGPAPSKNSINLKKLAQKSECVVSYLVRDPGVYNLSVTYHGCHVPRSPFEIDVGPESDCSTIAFGMGLYIGMVGQPSFFHISKADGSKAIAVEIQEQSGNQAQVPCNLQKDSNGSLEACFTPANSGEHAVHVLVDGVDITKSPWMVNVKPKPANSGLIPDGSKIIAYGPGIGAEVPVGLPTQFTVDPRPTNVEATLLLMCYDAAYGSPVDIGKSTNSDGIYSCTYTPTQVGRYYVYASYGNVPLAKSPFKIDAKKQETAPSNDNNDLIVAQGTGKVSVPQRQSDEEIGQAVDNLATNIADFMNDVDICVPKDEGDHGNLPLLTATKYEKPESAPRVTLLKLPVVYGPGLATAVVNKPARFTIYPSRSPPDSFSATVEGPSKISIDLNPQPDGTIDASYFPTAAGCYQVHVSQFNNPLEGSPWPVQVTEVPDKIRDSALRVTGVGRGLKRVAKTDTEARFNIDASRAFSPAELKVFCYDSENGELLNNELTSLPDNKYSSRYTPKDKFAHNLVVYITYGGANIARSPFHVLVTDEKSGPDVVRAYGPGLDKGVVGQPVRFTLFLNGVCDEVIRIAIENSMGDRVQTNAIRCEDGTLDITYSPTIVGDHLVSVTEQSAHIVNSPWDVEIYSPKTAENEGKITPDTVAHLVCAKGPGIGAKDVDKTNFVVDPRPAGASDDPKIALNCYEICGEPVETSCKPQLNKTFACRYVPKKIGPHVVYVTSGDVNILGSPFHVSVSELPPPASETSDPNVDEEPDMEPIENRSSPVAWTYEGDSENEEGDGEAVKGGTKVTKTKKKPMFEIELERSSQFRPSDRNPGDSCITITAASSQKSSEEEKQNSIAESKDSGVEITKNTVVNNTNLTADVTIALEIPSKIVEAMLRVKEDPICS